MHRSTGVRRPFFDATAGRRWLELVVDDVLPVDYWGIILPVSATSDLP